MPKVNSLEATRAIRNGENPLGKNIPIIEMTANAFSEDRARAIASGMNDHVAKPIDMEIFITTMLKYV